jgi:hypothetical protein
VYTHSVSLIPHSVALIQFHSTPAALRQGVAQAVFDLVRSHVVNVYSTHHPRPSDRVSLRRYSTSGEVFFTLTTCGPQTGCCVGSIRPREKSCSQCLFHSPSAALRKGVAQMVFDLGGSLLYTHNPRPTDWVSRRRYFDLLRSHVVVTNVFSTRHPRPSDRVTRRWYSTSGELSFTLTTRGPQTGCRAGSIRPREKSCSR